MVPMHAENERGLSMNRTMPCLQMNRLRILGSWSQCIRKNERGLSMNRSFGVSALAGPDRLKVGLQTNGVRRTASRSQCTARMAWGFSMNRPAHRSKAWPGKAALKTHALQTLRDCRASPNCAKRLECVRFIGAFRLAPDDLGFMVPMHGRRAEGERLGTHGRGCRRCTSKLSVCGSAAFRLRGTP
jgi:hypothetical protein